MENNYKKKIKLCEKLGALKFQKAVFKIEEIKYKLIKKLFPNYIKYIDLIINFNRNLKLKKAKTKEERTLIIDYYRTKKMHLRKEFLREENINYHINKRYPTQFITYLNWNKKIHKKGIIVNLILIVIFTFLMHFTFYFLPFIILEFISLFINFECVNIQNYNIYRFKEKEPKLKKIEEKEFKKNNEKYKEISIVVNKAFQNTQDIPTPNEILSLITTKKQLQELKGIVEATIIKNEKNRVHKK